MASFICSKNSKHRWQADHTSSLSRCPQCVVEKGSMEGPLAKRLSKRFKDLDIKYILHCINKLYR